MSPNTEHRKYASIMFTHLVGYGALHQRNEALEAQWWGVSHQVERLC